MYNREDTILRAINSVLSQKDNVGHAIDLELIVVDDGSTDGSVQQVQRIADERLILIQLNQNQGANKARNCGAAYAKGEYIAFQDSDDEWLPNKLAKQLSFLQTTNCDMVATGLSWRGPLEHYELKHQEGMVTSSELLKGNFLSTQTLFIKKSCFEQIKFDAVLPRLQDWDFVFRFSLRFQIAFLNQVLVYQYPTLNSISQDSQAKEEAVELVLKKFPRIFIMSKKDEANFYYHLGSLLDRHHARGLYLKSLVKQPQIKTIHAYLLSFF